MPGGKRRGTEVRREHGDGGGVGMRRRFRSTGVTRAHGTASKANLGLETIVVVWAPRELQIERQLARNGYGRDEAERRVDAQIPIDAKRAQAHHVIDNSGSLEDTRRQVEKLYALLTASAG